jgi:hypothetical protein
MKVKTAELIDAALDWAVAKCEEPTDRRLTIIRREDRVGRPIERETEHGSYNYEWWAPSRIWAQGGPIIDRERIGPVWNKLWNQWVVPHPKNAALGILGQTFLITAMRCFVTSRLGDEIEVPDELMACSNREADASQDQADVLRPRARG